MKHKVLVTGGDSLIGRLVLTRLQQAGDKEVFALVDPGSRLATAPISAEGFQVVVGEISDEVFLLDLLSDIDQVYHLEEKKSRKLRDSQKMWEVNVGGTANVINAALQTKVRKLVYLSSVEALGKSRSTETLHEKNIWVHSRWNTRYGYTKFLGELEVWRGMEEGLPAVALLPSTIFDGTGLLRLISGGLRFYPTGTTGWVDADDVARAALLAMETDTASQRYILNAGNYSFYDIFRAVGDALNMSTHWRRLPWFLKAFAWRMQRISPFFSYFDQETAVQTACTFHYLNQRSVDDLQLEYTPLHESIRKLIRAERKTI